MKAVILAAGIGSRMMPLTKDQPKPMVRLCGKPILEHILNSLPNEIDEILIVVGYKKESIQNYFGSSFRSIKITYVVQESPAGTADALLLCRPFFTEDERFLVLNADDIYDKESLERCLVHPRALLVSEVVDPRAFGVVELRDGVVTKLVEKPEHPASNFVAPGAYVLDTHLFEYEPIPAKNGERFFTTMLSQMLKDYPVHAQTVGVWINCTSPADIEKAEKMLTSSSINKTNYA